jgi:antitoxin MazE
MKTRLVRIGNSRGVRIPKPLLEQAGLEDEVELRVVEDGIVIASVREPRAGWEAAARLVRERGEDGLLDVPMPTRFDTAEWQWD